MSPPQPVPGPSLLLLLLLPPPPPPPLLLLFELDVSWTVIELTSDEHEDEDDMSSVLWPPLPTLPLPLLLPHDS